MLSNTGEWIFSFLCFLLRTCFSSDIHRLSCLHNRNWLFYSSMRWYATTVHLSCHARCRYVCVEREFACRQQMAEVIGRIRLLNRWQVGFYTSNVGCLYQWINWMHWFALLLSCNWRWADDEGRVEGSLVCQAAYNLWGLIFHRNN